MRKLLSALAIAALVFTSYSAEAGFGGSRSSSGSSSFSRSSSSSSSRSSSFGGSRSGTSSTGASRSSFGGSRSTQAAPIVRRQSAPAAPSSSTTTVNHYYNGGGGYYGGGYGGNGFVSGFMWASLFNRPQVVYVNGQQYVQGPNGQPMVDQQGQPVVYESHPIATAIAGLIWILIILGLIYLGYRVWRNFND